MFTPTTTDDVIGILREYNPKAIVTNPALIQETWVNPDVEIPTQEEYDAAKARLVQKNAAQSQARSAFEQALKDGYTIPGTQIVLSVSDRSRSNFNDLDAHLARLASAGQMTDETSFAIPDINNQKHQITYGDFKAMLIPFGMRCMQVFYMNPENQ